MAQLAKTEALIGTTRAVGAALLCALCALCALLGTTLASASAAATGPAAAGAGAVALHGILAGGWASWAVGAVALGVVLCAWLHARAVKRAEGFRFTDFVHADNH